MERHVQQFREHCGPHPCKCSSNVDSPMAWRYSVVMRDCAYSLTVCKSSGTFALHRAFGTEAERARFNPCDLLAGVGCILEEPYESSLPTAGVTVDEGLMFWSTYAVQGQREQPPKFWRELERRARAAAKAGKAKNYHSTRCPRCNGDGMIVIKPRKANEVKSI
jgi:hypothetical protein